MGRLILVTGGARSGKSDYALQLAQSLPSPRCFIATCPVVDSEMDERIARHREEREGEDWQTVEEQTDIAAILRRHQNDSVCLVDCLTLWVNNLLYHVEQSGKMFTDTEMRHQCDLLTEAASIHQGTVICVTNEVGLGIVPDNPSARLYRDLVGRCNRMMAAAASEVYLVSCGIPLQLK
ncbi:MAG: bifunctional adenosylcobinamide kinase/adenosylcobinamide-phosphate guanylyltransferase [Proteobacteria bacterium]|nr:bifunctional adenosylcobinamide kinase/adenosylcobinamide-phosphate guanylyltransferase [Pseudomonadota bacterium]MBU1649231.1 bifunctional adenosylcobinamide kinase/adenosylcobinamide-phosphate guanylyltransferase [Pseudomonadota bacterium]